MTGDLYLVEDPVAAGWRPFTLTRPAGELLFGTSTLRRRSESVTGATCAGYAGPATLYDFHEDGAPTVGPWDPAPSDRGRLFLLSRLVLRTAPALPPDRAVALEVGGSFAGLWLPPGAPGPDDLDQGAPSDLDVLPVDGLLLESVWELVEKNGDQLRRDGATAPATPAPSGVHHIGGGTLSIADGVTIEPGVVIDTGAGPVMIDRDVHIHAFTRLAGPAYIGPETLVLGGAFGEVSFGPVCRMRGEVRATVVLGYSNKAHDGFLGHSLLGRWVNLGAMTTNSNLKNNYGSIRMSLASGSHDTGMTKVGAFLGDHVKTGIGTLLNTGTVVEAASNLFGGAMPPKYVPPFSWGSGSDLTTHDLERFLQTAEVAMGRRGVTLHDRTRELYRTAFEATAPLRDTGA